MQRSALTPKYILGGIGACVIVVAATAYLGYLHFFDPDPYAIAFDAVVECAAQRDIIDCARPHVKTILSLKTARDFIEEVSERKLPANQCHYITHIVGQELFRETHDFEKAIVQCSHLCNAACPHGVIGEAFGTALHLDTRTDLGHLDAEQIRARGAELCNAIPEGVEITLRGMCHGVGHALFVAYQNFEDVFSVCREIATGEPRVDCYRGAYMEYTDNLIARSSWQDLYVSSLFPSVKELSTLCTRESLEEAEACFYYFPLAVRSTYANEGVSENREQSVHTRVKPICESYSFAAHRHSCLFGYGATLYEMMLNDIDLAKKTCNEFAKNDDQNWCMAGMISVLVEYGREDQVLAYCAVLESERQKVCIEALFEKVLSYSRSIDDVLALCPNDTRCMSSAEAARAGELRTFY